MVKNVKIGKKVAVRNFIAKANSKERGSDKSLNYDLMDLKIKYHINDDEILIIKKDAGMVKPSSASALQNKNSMFGKPSKKNLKKLKPLSRSL